MARRPPPSKHRARSGSPLLPPHQSMSCSTSRSSSRSSSHGERAISERRTAARTAAGCAASSGGAPKTASCCRAQSGGASAAWASMRHAREAAASSRGRQCSRITAQRSSGSSAGPPRSSAAPDSPGGTAAAAAAAAVARSSADGGGSIRSVPQSTDQRSAPRSERWLTRWYALCQPAPLPPPPPASSSPPPMNSSNGVSHGSYCTRIDQAASPLLRVSHGASLRQLTTSSSRTSSNMGSHRTRDSTRSAASPGLSPPPPPPRRRCCCCTSTKLAEPGAGYGSVAASGLPTETPLGGEGTGDEPSGLCRCLPCSLARAGAEWPEAPSPLSRSPRRPALPASSLSAASPLEARSCRLARPLREEEEGGVIGIGAERCCRRLRPTGDDAPSSASVASSAASMSES